MERASVSPISHFGLLWVRSWDNRGNCHMDEKRIQCLSNASQHVPIYLQPFPSNSTRKFKSSPFLHIFLPLAFNAPVGCSHWNSGKFGPQKTRLMGLPCSEDSLTIGWAVSTQYQRVTDKQTDGRPAIAKTCFSMADASKNDGSRGRSGGKGRTFTSESRDEVHTSCMKLFNCVHA